MIPSKAIASKAVLLLLLLLSSAIALDKGDPCTPQGGEKCLTAMCAAVPEGCTSANGPNVIDYKGTCCPKLCYAVDSEGNPCNGDKANAREINIQEEDSCVPKEQSTCPMASCAEAPEGCMYVDGPYAMNSMGGCCPKLCYAVTSEGNWCGEDPDNGSTALNSNNGQASAGNNTAEVHGMVASLLAIVHFFFGQ